MGDLFGAHTKKTFNILHRTIGTQFHKAKIDSHYRKVFNLAQSFLEDVARSGAESADMAPSLLPKMDSVGDAVREAWNYRADKRDAEAIAKPVFDGTLFEDEENKGKVWSDQELRDRYDLTDRQIDLYREFRNAVDHSLEALAIAEMNKTAKVNGLEAPKFALDILPNITPNGYGYSSTVSFPRFFVCQGAVFMLPVFPDAAC